MTGDGCRYCQPQEYIENLQEWLQEARDGEERHQRACEVLREALSSAQAGFPGAYVHEVVVLRKDRLDDALIRADAILEGGDIATQNREAAESVLP